MADLEAENADLHDRIADMESEIDELNARIATLESEAKREAERVDACKELLRDLEREISAD